MTNEEIVKAIQAGETDLIEILWNQCHRFIWMQADRWKRAWTDRTDIDTEDLVQTGYFALYAAVQKWDASKGCSFVGYLDLYLKTAFSEACSCRTTAQRAEPHYHALRLESPVTDDADRLTVADTLGGDCPGLEAIEENDYREYIAKVVREAVARLPENYRKAVEAHFLEGVPYTVIAENAGMSKQWAQQLGQLGLRKMREDKKNAELKKLYFGERNFYRGTGTMSWRQTGMSAPEREAIRLEMLLNSVQQ